MAKHGFDWALQRMREKKRVRRDGWRGKCLRYDSYRNAAGECNHIIVVETISGGNHVADWLPEMDALVALDWTHV